MCRTFLLSSASLIYQRIIKTVVNIHKSVLLASYLRSETVLHYLVDKQVYAGSEQAKKNKKIVSAENQKITIYDNFKSTTV